MVTTQFLVVTGLLIFSLGFIGLLIRRNLLIMLMCVELMLNGANLVLITYSRMHAEMSGQVFVLFVIAIAAAEVGVGLGIILSLFRRKDSLSTTDFRALKH